ncbi:glutamate synthase-related protein [Methanocaldococcus fervens]|uniref:Ferredoxin-dependent glutamate synthase n=1 Tax=Methanocaldococcus fervens (strain DSM 4213 / JCM 15782 / AG86) TaxID=573064 RepID=C7P672_METFA|nr:glutamate synthase-related protein [Methanocaldococcus fervens]ACV24054.1 ferredoxin-dependent glutamate synthase [Methanocaldococcus fervens AG86]
MERVFRNSSYLNAMSTTGTRTKVKDVNPQSGMCPICIKDCPFLCEIGLSTFRGREVLYPDPEYFGDSTASGLKDYGLDWSHFNILSRLIGAEGVEPDPDKMLFPNVNVESSIGGIRVKLPLAIGAYGSTDVAKKYWDGIAVGAALAGVILIVGENVCGVDPKSEFKDGKVIKSPEMERRVKLFREFWDGKYGDIAVQTNIEDQRVGVDEYVLSKLEVNIIERKWGQGAKAIGGEIRINSLERAIELKKRGYLIIPDPEDPDVQQAFKDGAFKTFERHSRVGSPTKSDVIEDVEMLREMGAKVVTIKTGAYRPVDVAWTMKVASEARVDYITFDGAGGGTGMSPVPMMNEMGVPTVYLEAIVLKAARMLKEQCKFVPDISMAGGFIDETQIFKAIAMSNFGEGPFVKTITMGRAPLTAVMKASNFCELAEKGKLPKEFVRRFGDSPEKFFIMADELKAKYGDKVGREIPWAAVGLYTYLDRIKCGLKQLMAGARKFRLDLIDRSDLAALKPLASEVTGIPMIHEVDKDIFELILGSDSDEMDKYF